LSRGRYVLEHCRIGRFNINKSALTKKPFYLEANGKTLKESSRSDP
jgi:hypothetical protein